MLGIIIAFEEYSPFLGYFDSKWIGAYNFKRLFSSTEFLRLLVNTLKLSGYNLLWSFFPPIILALLLTVSDRRLSSPVSQRTSPSPDRDMRQSTF